MLHAPPDEDQDIRLWDEISLKARDPWIYFYEDFLGSYDPKLRKDAGVYYTPVEVVRCQVRLIDELLKERLGRPLGFADEGVHTLDPAVGTGTYLLGVIDQAFMTAAQQMGPAGPRSVAADLLSRLYGFERMVGPYAVAELRITQAVERYGGRVPEGGLNVLLTDTLESPHAEAPPLFAYFRELARQHRRALEVKRRVPILVCLGNPPYDRHDRADDLESRAAAGGWVRWGEALQNPDTAILRDFIDPVRDAGAGVHAKNLYNLYVYFWRWAIWKVFEHPAEPAGVPASAGMSFGPQSPGIVSFISASSFLGTSGGGDAFLGLRRMLREQADEVWVLDLGGEGRGTRKEDNVFAIQTPVCITVAFRKAAADPTTPARVHYRRLRGTRAEKLRQLDDLRVLHQAQAKVCPSGWDDPFKPVGVGPFFDWPDLTDLMPWQHSGVQGKRLWPIGVSEGTLERRWRTLLNAEDRGEAFKESGDRQIDQVYGPELAERSLSEPVRDLQRDADPPLIVRYGYRSFDRHFIFAESSFYIATSATALVVSGQ